MQPSGNGLHLTVPQWVRAVSTAMAIGGYVAIFLWLPDDLPPYIFGLSLIFWTLTQVRAMLYSPEITVYENGIETSRLGIKYFTPWRDIKHIRVGEINSQVYPAQLHKLVRIFFYNNLLINGWRANYDEAIEIIKANVEETQKVMPKRAYETSSQQ